MIKTRFAPSPTGDIHIGNARTALFAWLFARNKNGKFLLRIEDTDLERSTKQSTEVVLNTLKWLGLTYDEEPAYQSQRLKFYEGVAQQLIQEKKAYYCNCSIERLEKLRSEQIAKKQKPKYDNHCRDLNLGASDSQVIRFRNPEEGFVEFNDLVYGNIKINNQELDDLIIMRSGGMPTYNFCATLDDLDFGITHIVRGEDHVNNTPKQINIIKALGKKPPIYAHLPMILNEEGKRLSKRRDASSVMQFREEGILPDALLNYLLRLGWSHGDQEIFSKEEMIKLFNIEAISKSSASFSREKLVWLNSQYMQNLSVDKIKGEYIYHLEKLKADFSYGPETEKVIELFATRFKTVTELANNTICLYQAQVDYQSEAVKKHISDDILLIVKDLALKLTNLASWDLVDIESLVKNEVKENKLKFFQLAQPIRIAITGGTVSPPVGQLMYLLGKSKAIQRLNAIISSFLTKSNQ